MLFLAYCKRPTQSTAAIANTKLSYNAETLPQANPRFLDLDSIRKAIPPLAGNYIEKQIDFIKQETMISLSRRAPRVSRRNKTDALSGLLQEVNPKHGGGYQNDAQLNPQE